VIGLKTVFEMVKSKEYKRATSKVVPLISESDYFSKFANISTVKR
jgi:hypothetical protein